MYDHNYTKNLFLQYSKEKARDLQCGDDKAYSVLGLFESPFFRAVSII